MVRNHGQHDLTARQNGGADDKQLLSAVSTLNEHVFFARYTRTSTMATNGFGGSTASGGSMLRHSARFSLAQPKLICGLSKHKMSATLLKVAIGLSL